MEQYFHSQALNPHVSLCEEWPWSVSIVLGAGRNKRSHLHGPGRAGDVVLWSLGFSSASKKRELVVSPYR